MFRNIVSVLCFVLLGLGVCFASCVSPANPIEAENCLPGNPSSQWDIGAGSAGDSTIQGFASDISVDVGQTINFKIDTNAKAYTIEIYRMGYYGGMGARLITTIQPSATLPQTQPACLTDSTTNLLDCGNWAISASWQVPTNATSGVYFAHLVRSDTGGDSHIVFVVRNDASTSAILFQTSDETWQAYNGYGGYSLYGPTDVYNLTERAYKVSYNRPFTTRGFGVEAVTWLFGAEYPMVRWLEANGYDVSYFTGVDAARNGSLIKNHKIYMDVGHDEYWTGPHRTSVEAARNAGVNLAFFSGNEVFWKTRWENSIDGTNTPYRTLVCYKETLGPNSNPTATAAVDPLDPPTWTGTWRDTSKSPPDDGGRPENGLTGTIFMVNGTGTDNPGTLSIKVPASYAPMRFWRNTTIANLQSGQTATLPPSSLGYEWDEDLDNGSRPPGTIDLSSATYTLTADLLLDAGGVYGGGTATHQMTLHRWYNNVGQPTQSPLGLIFGAGTIQWSWGLDSNHDNPITSPNQPADPDMQQATVNLFADMGVQPATLQGGLKAASESTDTVAPTSVITAPTNGTQVRVGTSINITGIATDTGGGIVAGVEISLDGGNTWHPASGTAGWTYAWTPTVSGNYTILSRATDDSANLEIPSAGVTVAASTSAQTLTSLTLSASSVSGGNTVQGTVSLGQPAASGGVAVTLSSSNSSVASVPPTVTVPSGQFGANFTITSFAVSVPTAVTISATYVATSNASLTVTNALPPPAGSVAIDAFVAKDQTSAASTIASGAFSTTVPNELILVLVTTDALKSGMTVSGISGGGLTWTLVERTNTQFGTAEIWRAFAATPVSNVSATATLSQSVISSMLVMSFAGVDTTGTNGSGAIGATGTGNANPGAPTASLTTTRNNSMVLGVGNDWDNAIARAVGSSQTLLHQYLANTGDTYWMQMQSSAIPTAGTHVTINDTSPTNDRYNLSIVEVLPAPAGTLSISGTVTPSTTSSGATVTLTGTANESTTVSSSGTYSFQNLVNGSYTVTPTKTGVVFNPQSQGVTLSGSNGTANFTAATLQSIAVTPLTATIQAGNTQPFTATGTYSDSSTQNITAQVTWSSTNGNVASVNTSGVATGIAGGSTSIVATEGSGETAISGNATLTVQATPLVITTTNLPSGLQNQIYAATLTATGGTAPYTWSLANGTTLPAGLTLSSNGSISGIPTVAGTGAFTVQVSDGGTPPQTATQSLSIVISSPPSFYTIWNPTTVPTNPDAGADSPVELGVLFESAVNGTISGIRFYKSANNTGTHVGNLWNGSGTLLSSATFSGESASGWQQVNFTTPVAITANTVYVASYHTAVGHYSDDENFFTSAGVNNPPLQAVQNSTSAPNGVFAYGTNSVFPNSGFNASNYWVDVIFEPSAILQSIAITPANPTIQVNGTQSFTATGTYSDSSTQNITTQVTWSSSNTAVATINTSGVASGVAGGASAITATSGSVTSSTKLTVQRATLIITTASLPGATQTLAYSATLASSGGTPPVSWSLIDNTVLPAGLSLSTAGQISGTPTTAGTTTFTVQVTDSGSPAQTASQTFSITVLASGCPCSIGGNISGTGGNGATVTLASGSSVTADASGNYIFNGISPGTYTVTPSKTGYVFTPASQSVTVSGSSVTGVNFSSTAQLAMDQAVWTDRGTKATTIVSPTFSTTKSTELLLAFVATDYLSGTNTTVTGVTGGTLTWTLVKRTNTQSGSSEIWRAFAPSTLSSVSVTATLSQSVAASISVVTFTGVDTTGTGGSGAIGATGTGNAKSGAPTASLTTTRNNSWVFGVGNDYDNAIARTPGANQTVFHYYLSTAGDTYWFQRQNSTTPTSGTVVTINDTAPTTDRYNLSICEILPAQ
ncbi:MAG TPA: N,N-dimethylformamidase beta subunit family domain-containing protein [Candidatus Sulfotelmatobacter sp.]|nr:N,N-dimethylformamidase beta subunit family domain-containing protein [Candidatus Sulfotelmatobacter sp.]